LVNKRETIIIQEQERLYDVVGWAKSLVCHQSSASTSVVESPALFKCHVRRPLDTDSFPVVTDIPVPWRHTPRNWQIWPVKVGLIWDKFVWNSLFLQGKF